MSWNGNGFLYYCTFVRRNHRLWGIPLTKGQWSRSFDVFCDVCSNKLSTNCRWFEIGIPWYSCDVTLMGSGYGIGHNYGCRCLVCALCFKNWFRAAYALISTVIYHVNWLIEWYIYGPVKWAIISLDQGSFCECAQPMRDDITL